MYFSSFLDAENYLLELQFSGIKLGLEQELRLLYEIGNPDKDLKFIHIAGTNGKGSTGALLSSGLSSTGERVGFYTSPHLFSIRERFRVNGKAISEVKFIKAVAALSVGIENMKRDGLAPTFFEATTALAALYFKMEEVDFVVWETGLGGRYDSTNVVDPVCSVLTGISIDHEGLLGDTLEKIAFEKAGIIKSNRPVFVGEVAPSVANVFKSVARERDARLRFVIDEVDEVNSELLFDNDKFSQKVNVDGDEFELSLMGNVQVKNATLGYIVIRHLCSEYGLDLNRALLGFAKVNWPGRFQVLTNGIVVDGAHNVDGACVLVESLKCAYPKEKFTFVFGNFTDKDSVAILEILRDVAARFVFVPITSGRDSCSPSKLSEMLPSNSEIEIMFGSDVVTGVTEGRRFNERVVVAGSLYLAGEFLSSDFCHENILDIY